MSSPSQRPLDRAGARKLVLALAMILPSALTWLYFVRLADAPAGVQQAVYACGKIVQFSLPALFVWLVLGVSLQLRRASRRGVGEGLASGLVFCLTAAGVYWLAARLEPTLLVGLGEQVAAKVSGLGLADGGRYLAVALFYSLVHSALEEYYWRWFVYGQLRRFLRPRPANGLAALGFMAHHVILIGFYTGWDGPAALAASLAIAAGGAYWAWLYERSGSLMGPWLSHLLADAAIFALGWRLL